MPSRRRPKERDGGLDPGRILHPLSAAEGRGTTSARRAGPAGHLLSLSAAGLERSAGIATVEDSADRAGRRTFGRHVGLPDSVAHQRRGLADKRRRTAAAQRPNLHPDYLRDRRSAFGADHLLRAVADPALASAVSPGVRPGTIPHRFHRRLLVERGSGRWSRREGTAARAVAEPGRDASLDRTGAPMRHCLLTIVVILSGACTNEELQRMVEQPKNLPYRDNSFFEDGRAMRTPPPGTVPREGHPANPALEPRRADGTYVDQIPIPLTSAVLRTGQKHFQ